jgi:hypothetical protein
VIVGCSTHRVQEALVNTFFFPPVDIDRAVDRVPLGVRLKPSASVRQARTVPRNSILNEIQ